MTEFVSATTATTRRLLYKDAGLSRLAERANVAQFVSFDPDLKVRYSRIAGVTDAVHWHSPEDAIRTLLARSPEGSVNVRSFDPGRPESREFKYGLTRLESVLTHVFRLAGDGLYTIVNETIDITDGGVSGVVLGDLIEFAPNDTPRCVEKPGVCSMNRDLGVSVLQAVYGFRPDLDFERTHRVEFSIHPALRGVRRTHTVVWEIDDQPSDANPPRLQWPNRFSRHLGDKVFGLLVADALGSSVPRTTVISRAVPPFVFGTATGTGETWIRTAPLEQKPGLYTTLPHWTDPFLLMSKEDPSASQIASVLAQEGIEAEWSGAAISTADNRHLVEGVRGRGDSFMVGRAGPETVPIYIVDRVENARRQLEDRLGPVRFEWVADSARVWVVQLHRGGSISTAREIVPGSRQKYVKFAVGEGIEALRALIAKVDPETTGIELHGSVGITSHFGDLLRRARIVSRIVDQTDES